MLSLRNLFDARIAVSLISSRRRAERPSCPATNAATLEMGQLDGRISASATVMAKLSPTKLTVQNAGGIDGVVFDQRRVVRQGTPGIAEQEAFDDKGPYLLFQLHHHAPHGYRRKNAVAVIDEDRCVNVLCQSWVDKDADEGGIVPGNRRSAADIFKLTGRDRIENPLSSNAGGRTRWT